MLYCGNATQPRLGCDHRRLGRVKGKGLIENLTRMKNQGHWTFWGIRLRKSFEAQGCKASERGGGGMC